MGNAAPVDVAAGLASVDESIISGTATVQEWSRSFGNWEWATNSSNYLHAQDGNDHFSGLAGVDIKGGRTAPDGTFHLLLTPTLASGLEIVHRLAEV